MSPLDDGVKCMDRSGRLLALLVALQSRQRVSARDLAEQFGVSKRTILRDIETLAAADIPVIAERGRYGGISLYRPAEVDVTRLTGHEAEILEVIGVDLKRARALGVEAAARSAARKIATRTPAPTHSAAPTAGLSDVVLIDDTGWFAPDEPAELAALTADVRTGRRLSIQYRSSGKPAPRTLIVDPYGIYARAGRWYLIADLDGQPRMFALARLSGWNALDEPKQTRPGTSLAEAVQHLVASLEGRHDVIVTALLDTTSVDMARRILGSRLLDITPTDNPGQVTIRVGYDQLDAVRQLMQFTDHIEITDPPNARALVEQLAGRIAERHR